MFVDVEATRGTDWLPRGGQRPRQARGPRRQVARGEPRARQHGHQVRRYLDDGRERGPRPPAPSRQPAFHRARGGVATSAPPSEEAGHPSGVPGFSFSLPEPMPMILRSAPFLLTSYIIVRYMVRFICRTKMYDYDLTVPARDIFHIASRAGCKKERDFHAHDSHIQLQRWRGQDDHGGQPRQHIRLAGVEGPADKPRPPSLGNRLLRALRESRSRGQDLDRFALWRHAGIRGCLPDRRGQPLGSPLHHRAGGPERAAAP